MLMPSLIEVGGRFFADLKATRNLSLAMPLSTWGEGIGVCKTFALLVGADLQDISMTLGRMLDTDMLAAMTDSDDRDGADVMRAALGSVDVFRSHSTLRRIVVVTKANDIFLEGIVKTSRVVSTNALLAGLDALVFVEGAFLLCALLCKVLGDIAELTHAGEQPEHRVLGMVRIAIE